MSCCNRTIYNSPVIGPKDDEDRCFCILTNGDDCVCLFIDEDNKITRCNDCKCAKYKCNCKKFKCVGNKNCICVPTNGKSCICVNVDKSGNIKVCDDCQCSADEAKEDSGKCGISNKFDVIKEECCAKCQCNSGENTNKCSKDCKCTATENSCLSNKLIGKGNTKCVGGSNTAKCFTCVHPVNDGSIQVCKECQCGSEENVRGRGKKLQDKISQSNNCICNKLASGSKACICLLTGDKSCICLYTDKSSNIQICEDCQCESVLRTKGSERETQGKAIQCHKCKCNIRSCICLCTEGKSCICVRTDEHGNVQVCSDCECDKGCCKKSQGKIIKCSDCKCIGPNGWKCTTKNDKCVCLSTNGDNCICLYVDKKGNIQICEDCKCVRGSEKERREKINQRINGKNNERCGDCKCTANKKCICLSTEGKSCICVCTDEHGNIQVCGDCECVSGECDKGCCKRSRGKIIKCSDCKCNGPKGCKCTRDKKCVCLSTDGNACICLYVDKRRNIQICEECQCVRDNNDKQGKITECIYCKSNKPCGNCKCNTKCNECICLLTDGKSCICVRTDEYGNIQVCTDCDCVSGQHIRGCSKKSQQKIIQCTNCKCNKGGGDCNCTSRVEQCVCISTVGRSCICLCTDEHGNIQVCQDCQCVSGQCMRGCGKKLEGKINKCNNCECNERGSGCKCASKDKNCICISAEGKSCIYVCTDEHGNIQVCEDCEFGKCRTGCCGKLQGKVKKCCNCLCNKRSCKCTARDTNCICLYTERKSCICVSTDQHGNIRVYEDCKCESDGENIRCCEKKLKGKTLAGRRCCTDDINCQPSSSKYTDRCCGKCCHLENTS